MTQGQPGIEGGDERTASRIARADRFFKEHLRDQQSWYSKKASRYRDYAQWLSLTIIFTGAFTGFIQIFPQAAGDGTFPAWPAIVTALLSLVVVITEGLARIGRYRETWVAYRKASEQMKREYRLYINNAGGYEKAEDEEAAYRRLVENVEQVIAEEQQLYWQGPMSAKTGTGAAAGDKDVK